MSVIDAPPVANVERQLQDFFVKHRPAAVAAPTVPAVPQEVEVIDFVASTTKDLNTTLAMYFLLAVGLRTDRDAWLQQQFEVREAWRPIVQTVLPQARDFLARPVLGHIGNMWKHRTVRRYLLTTAVARRLVRFLELIEGQLEEDERESNKRWEIAIKADPTLSEAAKINSTNFDSEEIIPADWSRIPPRRTA